MMIFRSLFVGLILSLSLCSVYAQGLVEQLPPKNAWVDYYLEYELEGPEASDGKGIGTWRISSVGSETIDGTACRWLEFRETLTNAEAKWENQLWYKFLVPEDAIGENKQPLKQAVRSWLKVDDQDEAYDFDHPIPINPTTWRFLPSPHETKTLEIEKTVPYQKGNLRCQKAIRHNKRFEYEARNVAIEYTVWPHKEVPFGVAMAHIKVVTTRKNGDESHTWTYNLTLNDFGERAKSDLPDLK